MILAVALNAAVDVTYTLPAVRWDETNRVHQVGVRAGGKAVNVARVLRILGRPVTVTGFSGGRTGQEISAELAADGIDHAFVPVAGETRRTVTIVEVDAVTVFNEPGPHIGGGDWHRFVGRLTDLLGAAEALVLSGSLPPGVPNDAYAVLSRLAARAGVPAVLDADATTLRLGVAGRPAIVKPNTAELARATSSADPLAGAEALRRAGAGSVVVSLGPAGFLACTPDGRWRAKPPDPLPGNPTGAGDAAVAGLVSGLVGGQPWPERLAHATALSAAAVLAPVAGELNEATYRTLLGQVEVTRLEGTCRS
jgi:tagatose 6-phosphate kinase